MIKFLQHSLPAFVFLLCFPGCAPEQAASPAGTETSRTTPLVQVGGTQWLDPEGNPLTLRGVNLGNWLLLEMWMFGNFELPDQASFFRILDERFGRDKREALIDLHRKNWIQESDFARIRSMGMNLIRLPLHYSLFDEAEGDAEAFRWIDWTLKHAGENDIYVILDLHGAPGGQSTDQPTGEVGRNELWGSEPHQQETERIWRSMARRYRNDPRVAAYDLLNEPFGSGRQQAVEPELIEICQRLISAIREEGDQHVLLAPGTLKGAAFYPASFWRENPGVALTEHFYPGVFDDVPGLHHHLRYMQNKFPAVIDYLKQHQVAFFVGEYNVVKRASGGDPVMRHYIDLYDRLGWAHTMWAYKGIDTSGGIPPDNWQIVSNRDPLVLPDPKTAEYSELEAFFTGLLDVEWIQDDALVACYTEPKGPAVLTLPQPEEAGPDPFLPDWMEPPPVQLPDASWMFRDIGGSSPSAGLVRMESDAGYRFSGGGFDIYRGDDVFGYLYKPVSGNLQRTIRIHAFSGPSRYSKAGIMVRESASPDSPHGFLHLFPDGTLTFAHRRVPGGQVQEKRVGTVSFPVDLRVTRTNGDDLTAEVREKGAAWRTVGRLPVSAVPDQIEGVAVLSHDPYRYAFLEFELLD